MDSVISWSPFAYQENYHGCNNHSEAQELSHRQRPYDET